MKKILFLTAISLLSNICLSQNNLEFKGIPIKGTLTDFGTKLESQGYKKVGKEGFIYSGTFANQDCDILLSSVTNTNEMLAVYVTISKKEWNSLESLYYEFKEQLSKKYGNPAKYMEHFDYPYRSSDSPLSKWTALKVNKAHFTSFFELGNGNITVMMYSEGGLLIAYTDKQAEKKSKEKEQKSFSDDL
jgi:hypothetical protein